MKPYHDLLRRVLKNGVRVPTRAKVGGASVFAQFLPYVDAVHWTRVDAEVEGDTVFSFRPDLGPAWRMVGVEEVVPADAENEHPSAYMLFERR